MKMENDEFKISEQYLKMSVAELEIESRKVMERINNTPRKIVRKKKAAPGCKEITFNVG